MCAKVALIALHFVGSKLLFDLVMPSKPAIALRIPDFHPSIPKFIFHEFDLQL